VRVAAEGVLGCGSIRVCHRDMTPRESIGLAGEPPVRGRLRVDDGRA
jgi:hypothetical protein